MLPVGSYLPRSHHKKLGFYPGAKRPKDGEKMKMKRVRKNEDWNPRDHE